MYVYYAVLEWFEVAFAFWLVVFGVYRLFVW